MSAALASGDAIAAIATPAGRGGVGVIRISGANLEGWIERLTDFSMHKAVPSMKAWCCGFPVPRPIPERMCSNCRVTAARS